MGVTSKGVFLLFGKSSLFLTRDTHMSPFNIILSPENALPRELSIGAPVYYSQGDLLIPDCQLTISLVDTPVWTPPPPCPLNASRAEQVSNARIIYQGLQNFDPQKGFLFLVNKATADTPEQTQIRQSVKSFSKAFIGNDLQTCLHAAAHLFGLGTGLTPSGDDWITGFMLYQCCREIATKKAPRPFIASLGAELVFTAYHQTTLDLGQPHRSGPKRLVGRSVFVCRQFYIRSIHRSPRKDRGRVVPFWTFFWSGYIYRDRVCLPGLVAVILAIDLITGF